MRRSAPPGRSVTNSLGLILASVVVAGFAASSASAASPTPQPNPSITLSAQPMLGGSFRPNSWAPIRVLVENSGPTVDGELRLSSTQSSSTFSLPVQLPPGARQEHILYARIGPLGNRITVTLGSGEVVAARQTVAIQVRDQNDLRVYVVAENPQTLTADLRQAGTRAGLAPQIVSLTPEDLPPRAEAWSSVDVVVWRDFNSVRMDTARWDAMRAWLSSGGTLIVVGGTVGGAALTAFPGDLLPYRPTAVVDTSTADLERLLGALPAGALPSPALSGPLERGTSLADVGGSVIAARTPLGRGTVVLVGVDLGLSWLAGTPTASAFWGRLLPSSSHTDPFANADESYLVNALGNLPAVQLPRFNDLLLLIVGYLVVIGPLNYLLLKRRDRREWAWITMPLTMVAFAVAIFGLGALLRGADVIVNELAVVHGAAGSDRGLARVQVGVFSPTRQSFDIKVGGGVLLSAPAAPNRFPGDRQQEQPVDIVMGDTATLRSYGVGYGSLRAFRAEVLTWSPKVDTALSVVDGGLSGTVTNSSGVPLEDVSVVYGDGVEILGDMAAGESKPVNLSSRIGDDLVQTLLPYQSETDPDRVRALAARRAIVQHLVGGFMWEDFGGPAPFQTANVFQGGPVVLAWLSGSTLDIDVGTEAERVGERLYLLPASAGIRGPVVFNGALIRHSTVSIDAIEGFEIGDGTFSLNRGTLTVEYRPVGFDGAFEPSLLLLRVGRTNVAQLSGGEPLVPLPDEDQPDQDQPLASDPRPGIGITVPRLQLFERALGAWVEFEPVTSSRTYRVDGPERYLDGAGVFLVRFVSRDSAEYVEFALSAELEGTVE